ncbi:MAG: GNAT family N-acetyltransferase [Chloroflexota bacterium]
MSLIIRPETPADIPAIFHVHQRAFGRDNEARLVNKLRGENAIVLSLVAQVDEAIVGHILFSPVTIRDGETEWQALGLGPVAVLPEFQNQGIGSKLIRAGLAELKAQGHGIVIVLGHAEYYPRFGFKPSKPLGIQWEVNVPEEVFMVAELKEGALHGRTGIVRYHPLFGMV